jgi:hypothetical protein
MKNELESYWPFRRTFIVSRVTCISEVFLYDLLTQILIRICFVKFYNYPPSIMRHKLFN